MLDACGAHSSSHKVWTHSPLPQRPGPNRVIDGAIVTFRRQFFPPHHQEGHFSVLPNSKKKKKNTPATIKTDTNFLGQNQQSNEKPELKIVSASSQTQKQSKA